MANVLDEVDTTADGIYGMAVVTYTDGSAAIVDGMECTGSDLTKDDARAIIKLLTKWVNA